jgi:hypothetical protein
MEIPNMRTKIAKVGVLLIIIAVFVAFTTVFGRDSVPDSTGMHFQLGPNLKDIEVTIRDSRAFRVIIDVSPATSRISVFLLDSDGIQVFHEQQRLQPVFSLEDVDGCDFTYQPPSRGIYAFIIENKVNQSTRIDMRVIGQGLEWDILQFSAIVGAIGIAAVLVSKLPTLQEKHKRPPT